MSNNQGSRTQDVRSRSRDTRRPRDARAMSLLPIRGRREDRVSADTHGPRAIKKHAAEPQVGRVTGLPCAMVLRLIRDLPGDRAFLPPSLAHAHCALCELSASIGAPGPHDFAVRGSFIRPRNTAPEPLRPSHPAPNVRDDRETPLMWERDGDSCKFDLGFSRSDLFWRRRLDRFSWKLRDLPVVQSHNTSLAKFQTCLLNVYSGGNN
jgi:hypothetical protein